MNTQKQVESAKDDDFDFFKKPKDYPEQNDVGKAVMEKEVVRLAIESKQRKTILFLGILIPMILLSVMNEPKPVQVTHNGGWVVAQPLIESKSLDSTPINNKTSIDNVDYSNLSKEDAENVKQVLKQFEDVQKTLIETTKPKKPQ